MLRRAALAFVLVVVATGASAQIADIVPSVSSPSSGIAGGAPFNATVSVSNIGGLPVSNVTLTYGAPSGPGAMTQIVSFVAPAGMTCMQTSESGLQCTAATMAAGQTLTVDLVLRVRADSGDFFPTAHVASVTTTTFPENSGNNTVVVPFTVVQVADVRVAKTGPARVLAGGEILYNITVTDDGPSNAIVTLTDNVPTGTTFVSFTRTSGPFFTCTTPAPGGTGTISCTANPFAAGATATFELRVNTAASTDNLVTNTATVSAQRFPSGDIDPDPSDNTATAITAAVVSIPALSPTMLFALVAAMAAAALFVLRRA